ncbi:MAG: hypothetical protein ACRC11_05315 [Xenococcaceae cyanobacterium]
MIILGLDVGRGSAVGFVLDCFPVNAKQHFTRNRQNILRLKTDADSVDKVLAIAPDAIVLEPTGSWYSLFWAKVAATNGIQVCWVGHGDLAAQRNSYGFINKRDDEDAYCLALCWFDPTFINVHGQKRFLSWYDCDRINSIRSQFYDLEQLDKLRTSFINQTRQRLALEFPEAATQAITQSVKLGYSPFIGWLAGIHKYTRIENKYKRSIIHTLNVNLTDYTRAHARAIVDLELRAKAIEDKIDRQRQFASFAPYLKVFEKFGFGQRLSILMLIQIYPLEKFLVDGKPWVETEIGYNGKPQLRYRSLRGFQLYLGLGYKWVQSGEKVVRVLGGSTVCRSHLYMWAFDRIAPQEKRRLQTAIGQNLGAKYDKLRRGEVKIAGKDAIVRILYKATRLLFEELCKELL